MSYTWQALWKKKQRTGSVNVIGNTDCLGCFMALTMNRYQGMCHGEDEKVLGGLDIEKGFGSGWV